MLNRKRGPTQRNNRYAIIIQKLHYFLTNISNKVLNKITQNTTKTTNKITEPTNKTSHHKRTVIHHQDQDKMPVSLSVTNTAVTAISIVIVCPFIIDFIFYQSFSLTELTTFHIH